MSLPLNVSTGGGGRESSSSHPDPDAGVFLVDSLVQRSFTVFPWFFLPFSDRHHLMLDSPKCSLFQICYRFRIRNEVPVAAASVGGGGGISAKNSIK